MSRLAILSLLSLAAAHETDGLHLLQTGVVRAHGRQECKDARKAFKDARAALKELRTAAKQAREALKAGREAVQEARSARSEACPKNEKEKAGELEDSPVTGDCPKPVKLFSNKKLVTCEETWQDGIPRGNKEMGANVHGPYKRIAYQQNICPWNCATEYFVGYKNFNSKFMDELPDSGHYFVLEFKQTSPTGRGNCHLFRAVNQCEDAVRTGKGGGAGCNTEPEPIGVFRGFEQVGTWDRENQLNFVCAVHKEDVPGIPIHKSPEAAMEMYHPYTDFTYPQLKGR